MYKYELWDTFPLEGEYKGIQINEIPAKIVALAYTEGKIDLSTYCLKMLIVELLDNFNNLQKLVDSM